MTAISLCTFVASRKWKRSEGTKQCTWWTGGSPSFWIRSATDWQNGFEITTELLWASVPSPVSWHISFKIPSTRIYNSKILWVYQIPLWSIPEIRSFIKVDFLFLKENEVKRQISGLHPGTRPPVEHSQGTILVSLLFFCASLAISVLVLPFNNSLKSESSGALRCDWQAGSLESNRCCWHREPSYTGTLPGGIGKRNFFFPRERSTGWIYWGFGEEIAVWKILST